MNGGDNDDLAAINQRFERLVGELEGRYGISRSTARGFGGGTLQVDGRIFAMVSRGRLVLKLPARRVSELLAAGSGEPFDAGKGRPLREWIALLDADDDVWLGLAIEASRFVARRASSPGS